MPTSGIHGNTNDRHSSNNNNNNNNSNSHNHTAMVCSKCQRTLRSKDHVVALPCNDLYCAQCFLVLLAQRPADSFCKCCVCNGQILGHRYEAKNQNDTQNKKRRNVQHRDPTRDCKLNPDENKDPFRSFVKKKTSDQHGFVYLAISDPKAPASGQFLTHKCCFGSNGIEEEGRKDLDCIFMFLHHYIVAKERSKTYSQQQPMNAAELSIFALDDKRTLLRCLYALGNGIILTDELRAKVRHEEKGHEKSCFMGSYAATDVIFRLQQRDPCPLQRCISEAIDAMTGSKLLLQLLSFFRICTSPKPIAKAINASWKSLPPLRLHPRDYHVASLDNLGFHDKKNVSYDQWVVFLYQIVTEDQLKKLGFYCQDPRERISRQRKTLEEFISEAGGETSSKTDQLMNAAEYLVSPKEADYEKESFYNLRQLEYCIAAELPTYEECKGRLKRRKFTTTYTIARNFGIDVEEKPRCCKKDGTFIPHKPKKCVRRSGWQPPDEPVFKSILDANNYMLDTPVHDDLCKRNTVEDLMKYVVRTCDDVVAKATDNAEEHDEPPVQAIHYAFTADGSPINASINIKSASEENAHQYRKLDPFFGGFHFMVQQVSMAAELSYEFRRNVIKGWRPSTKKQEWVMSPSNPKQFETEVISQMAAMWRAAIDCYAEHKNAENVSAAEVHRFMVDKAETYPFNHAQLIDYRWLVVYFMLRDSEVSLSVDLFFAAVRLTFRLCTVCNATNYTPMTAKLLLWWEQSSAAERILFENFVFSSKTPGGHNIFKDRAQEKVQLMYRHYLGRLKTPGLAKKMHYVTEHLEALVASKKALASLKGESPLTHESEPFNQQAVEVGEVYIKTYMAFCKMFCWDAGIAPVIGKNKRTMRNCSDKYLESPSGQLVPANVLRSWSIGKERLTAFSFNMLRGLADLDDDVDERESTLSRISSRSSVLQEHSNRRRRLRLSTSTEAIEDVNRLRMPLIDELLRLKEMHPGAPQATEVTDRDSLYKDKDLKVKDLTRLLVDYRMNLYESQPNAKKNERDSLATEEKQACAMTREERKEELADPHYSLLPRMVNRFGRRLRVQVREAW